MDDSPTFKTIPDISGSVSHGPQVLSSLVAYEDGPLLRWSTKEECRELATSKDLYSRKHKFNTLTCIQGTVLPELFQEQKFGLLAVFFQSNDERIRQKAFVLFEKILLTVEHFSDTVSSLSEAEETIHDVLEQRLNQWLVLSSGDELYVRTLVRLYLMVLTGISKACLQEGQHTDFKEKVKKIRQRKELVIPKSNKKNLAKLDELLRVLEKYKGMAMEKYGTVYSLCQLVVEKEEIAECKDRFAKEPWTVKFATLYSALLKFFQSPTLTYIDLLKEVLQRCTTKSDIQKRLTSDLVVHSLIAFLLQHLPAGKLPGTEVNKYSTKLIELIFETSCDNWKALDVIMFVKNKIARQRTIEIFDSKGMYESEFTLSNIRMIEQLLSATVMQFSAGSIMQHPDSEEWKTCSGTFGKKRVLLIVYIPERKNHENDVYIESDSVNAHGPFKEVNILKALSQEANIIQVLALSLSKLPYFYITEDYLHNNLQIELMNKSVNRDVFSHKELLGFLVSVASALEFLHSHGIIHRDITGASVFLNDDGHAKLGRFSLAYQGDTTTYLTRSSEIVKFLPTRYLAPESLQRRAFSKASDVWMFGCLMYEVLTHGCLPYSDVREPDRFIANLVIQGRKRPFHEKCIPSKLFNIITQCTDSEKSKRPDVAEVRRMIEEEQTTYKDGLKSGKIALASICFPDLENERIPASRMTRGIPRGIGQDDDGPNRFRDIMEIYQTPQDEIYEDISRFDIAKEQVIEHHAYSTDLSRLEGQDLPGIPKLIIKTYDYSDVISYDLPDSIIGTLWSVCSRRQLGRGKHAYLECLRVVANTLFDLHDHGWVHANISADNILIGTNDYGQYALFYGVENMVFVGSCSDAEKSAFPPNSQERRLRSAPEVMSNGIFSPASDVFSFGFVLWNVCETIYADSMRTADDVLSRVTADEDEDTELYSYFSTVPGNAILPHPKDCPADLYRIILSCWRVERNKRPTMEQVMYDIIRYVEYKGEDDDYMDIQDEIYTDEVADCSTKHSTLTRRTAPPRAPSEDEPDSYTFDDDAYDRPEANDCDVTRRPPRPFGGQVQSRAEIEAEAKETYIDFDDYLDPDELAGEKGSGGKDANDGAKYVNSAALTPHAVRSMPLPRPPPDRRAPRPTVSSNDLKRPTPRPGVVLPPDHSSKSSETFSQRDKPVPASMGRSKPAFSAPPVPPQTPPIRKQSSSDMPPTLPSRNARPLPPVPKPEPDYESLDEIAPPSHAFKTSNMLPPRPQLPMPDPGDKSSSTIPPSMRKPASNTGRPAPRPRPPPPAPQLEPEEEPPLPLAQQKLPPLPKPDGKDVKPASVRRPPPPPPPEDDDAWLDDSFDSSPSESPPPPVPKPALNKPVAAVAGSCRRPAVPQPDAEDENSAFSEAQAPPPLPKPAPTYPNSTRRPPPVPPKNLEREPVIARVAPQPPPIPEKHFDDKPTPQDTNMQKESASPDVSQSAVEVSEKEADEISPRRPPVPPKPRAKMNSPESSEPKLPHCVPSTATDVDPNSPESRCGASGTERSEDSASAKDKEGKESAIKQASARRQYKDFVTMTKTTLPDDLDFDNGDIHRLK